MFLHVPSTWKVVQTCWPIREFLKTSGPAFSHADLLTHSWACFDKIGFDLDFWSTWFARQVFYEPLCRIEWLQDHLSIAQVVKVQLYIYIYHINYRWHKIYSITVPWIKLNLKANPWMTSPICWQCFGATDLNPHELPSVGPLTPSDSI